MKQPEVLVNVRDHEFFVEHGYEMELDDLVDKLKTDKRDGLSHQEDHQEDPAEPH